jgi:hypothetical protein
LNSANLVSTAQSAALLQEIEQQTSDECKAQVAAAEQQAQALIAQAHAAARRRVHEAIVELRREGARRLARAKAQVETQARQRAQQHAVAVIGRAWPLLADALVARWRDPAARQAWADGVARCARDRLRTGTRTGTWTVEHPADWSADEQRNFRIALGAGDDAITFTADGDIAAGIRIRAAEATLDATPQGLLVDRQAVAALLLAEIAATDDRWTARPSGEQP